MLLILTSIFVLIFVAISINAAFVYFKEAKLKKRLTGRFEEATSEAGEQKGMTKSILKLASAIGGVIERTRIPIVSSMADNIRINLGILGEPYSNIKPFTFIGMQLLAAGASALLLGVAVFRISNSIGLLLFALAGFFLPLLWVSEQVKAKHKAIFKQLPYVLDLLTLMVEAGLDFGAALNKVLESERGALIDEFSITQQEIKLGKARDAALISMSERVNYLSLATVINALVLAFKTGGSIAPTLRILSEQFRVERSQLAEKMAGQAPLKMMGPLILLIFPTIFIILFGPIVLSFMGGKYW